jgi:hypothetical protein
MFPFILILVILHFYERLIFLDSSGSRISVADFLLVMMAIFYIFTCNFKLNRKVLFLAAGSIAIIFISGLINNISLLNTAMISVPSRFLISGYVFYSLMKIKNKRPIKISLLLFVFCLAFLLIFFSGTFGSFDHVDFVNPNEAGIYMIIAFIFYISLFKPNIFVANIIALFLLIFFLILGSRQLLLSVLIPIFIYSIIRFIHEKSFFKRLILLSSFIILCIITIASFLIFVQDDYGIRRFLFLIDFDLITSSDNLRMQNYIFVLDNFSSSTLFGHGLGSFFIDRGEGVVAHSGFLTTFYEFGLMGGLFIFFIFYILLKPLLQSISLKINNWTLVFACCLLIGVFIQLFFIELYSKLSIPISIGIALYLSNVLKRHNQVQSATLLPPSQKSNTA